MSLELTMAKWHPLRGSLRTLLGYAVALIGVGTTVAATLGVGAALKHTPTLFFCAVALSSWVGGIGPGILAGVLSALALDYYFIPPLRALGLGPEEAPNMVAFLASAGLISWLSGEQRRAERALRQARDELELKVQQQTAELRQTNERLQVEIAERKLAQEGLIRAQAEAAHAGRILTMGELAATIAHELNQPLAGVVTSADACLRWLAQQPPNLDRARQAVERAIRDAARASGVLARVRGLLKKGPQIRECVDLNGLIEEVLALTEGELCRHGVSLQTELVPGLPVVSSDRVQLQQVILNLVINAIE